MTTSSAPTLVVITVMAFGACAPPQVPPPKFAADADEAMRRKLYDDNKLTFQPSWWSPRWHRGAETYQVSQLDRLFDSKPRTHELQQRLKHRGAVIGALAITGGAVLGFTLGYNLGANRSTQMSPDTQATLYGVGGGLIVASLITMLLWHDPSPELAETYNQGLRNDLGLSGPSALHKPPTRSLAVAPAMVNDGAGIGLSGQF
jgi:hypothetical protein